MSNKDKQSGELSQEQLDGVSGGQEVRKLEKVTVTAQRPADQPAVVKLDKVVVTAKREDVNIASAAVNTAGIKKN